jgi:hypothetical protein
MDRKNISWIGLISGVLLVAVIVLSLFNPWWQLRIGDFVYANFSPMSVGFNFIGITFLVPLLTAINISSLLLLSISAALMIVYSINPGKEYSKQLLCWSYKKPLFTLIAFIAGIVALSLGVSYIAGQYANLDFTLPIMGSTIVQVPSEMLGQLSGVQIGMTVSTSFHWTFYLAIAATALCIVTRYYHGKPLMNTAQLANVSSETTIPVPAQTVLNASDSPKTI